MGSPFLCQDHVIMLHVSSSSWRRRLVQGIMTIWWHLILSKARSISHSFLPDLACSRLRFASSNLLATETSGACAPVFAAVVGDCTWFAAGCAFGSTLLDTCGPALTVRLRHSSRFVR